MNNTNRRRVGAKVTLVLLSVFILLILLSSAVSSQMLGDVNIDGFVDIRDVVLVQRYVLGQQMLTPAQLTAADVNGDGVVNVVDVNLMMQYIQGYINSFPTHHLHAPVLIAPVAGASVDGSMVSFQWGAVTGATRYQLEITKVSDGTIFRTIDLGNDTTTTQYAFANDGAQYRWRVRAGSSTQWGAWSLHRTFTNGAALPAPTLSSPANNSELSSSSVLFRWNAVSGATKYQLEVLRGTESEPFKDVTVGNITMSEQFGFLRDGTQYRWRVRAGNNTDWGAWSGYFTLTSGQLLAAPVLTSPIITLTPVPGRQITFSWQAVTRAINYELEIVNERTGAFVTKASVGNVTSSPQRGFEDDGTTYKWRVRAASSEGWGAWSNYVQFINGSAPGAPVLSRPEPNEKFSVDWMNFEWKPVPGADRYELEIKDKSNKVYRTEVVYGRTTSLQQDFPVDGGQYTWTVRSGNANGWSSIWAPSRSFTVGSAYAIPTLISPQAFASINTEPIKFSWNAVSNASKYEVEITDVRFGTPVRFTVDNATNTEQSGFNFTDGKQYRWRVRAGNGTNWGDWSASRDFITENKPNSNIPALSLLSPADTATAGGDTIGFKCTLLHGVATYYQFQIVRVAGGQMFRDVTHPTTPLYDADSQSFKISGFPDDGTVFMWRVRAGNAGGAGGWSFYRTFTNGSNWWQQ